MMYNISYVVYILVVYTALAMLIFEISGEDSEETRRAHKRRKRPCGKGSPRWFFAHDITILLGDLTVVNSVPCGTTGLVLDKPIVQQQPLLSTNNGQKPGLFGHHHHHHHGGGLFGSHQQGGGLLGSHQQGGGLLGSHHQGGGLFGQHHQGGGLLGSHQQGQGGSNGAKPVFENEAEESDSSTAAYKPGAIVGALSGQVSGFQQDLSHLSVLERINEHVGRLFKPFVDLFLR